MNGMLRKALVGAFILAFVGWAFAQNSSEEKDSTTDKAVSKPASEPTSKSTSKPGSKAGNKSDPKKAAKTPKFAIPEDEEVQKSIDGLKQLGDKAGLVTDKLHKLETPHFIVYSAFEKSSDKVITDTCETLYKLLCQQLDVANDEPVFIGKCGLFLFSSENQFVRFTVLVDKMGGYGKSGAYWKGRTPAYIVINNVRDMDYFKQCLIDMTTLAFMSRYVSEKNISDWVTRGIGQTMSATIAPSKNRSGRLKQATKEALKGKDVIHIFDSVETDFFDFGITHSWVQYLIARDRKAFIKFVGLLKEGKKEEEAMQETFKMDRETFLKSWATAASKAIR